MKYRLSTWDKIRVLFCPWYILERIERFFGEIMNVAEEINAAVDKINGHIDNINNDLNQIRDAFKDAKPETQEDPAVVTALGLLNTATQRLAQLDLRADGANIQQEAEEQAADPVVEPPVEPVEPAGTEDDDTE